MEDLIIGIVATLLSTVIISLWGIFIITPYNEQRKIYKKILKTLRNYKDPRKYENKILPDSITINCIKEQVDSINEILDLLEEQKDLNHFLYWLFNYEKVKIYLRFLLEYIRDPIMLKEQRQFESDYILDSKKLFHTIKKKSRIPIGKIILLFLIIAILLITIIVIIMYLTINH